MKTTIELPDELAREARQLARERGTTLKELVVDGLRSEVERRREPGDRADFVFPTFLGNGYQPGIDPHRLLDYAYENEPPVIAVDSNVLVSAYRRDAVGHERAAAALHEMLGRGSALGVPWPCVHEFLNVVTHPRVFDPPTPPAEALHTMQVLTEAPAARLLSETSRHLDILSELMQAASAVVGPKIHDARIAAICLGHGVTELWTADRDFSYFPTLRTRNPLVE